MKCEVGDYWIASGVGEFAGKDFLVRIIAVARFGRRPVALLQKCDFDTFRMMLDASPPEWHFQSDGSALLSDDEIMRLSLNVGTEKQARQSLAGIFY